MSARLILPFAAARRRPGGFAWSRLVLIAVLLLGQILTPAVATHCDVGDALAAAEERAATPLSDMTPAAATDIDSPDGGCCDGGCIDCCLHASPVLSPSSRLPAPSLASSVPLPRAPAVVPGDYPVDVRPPIAS